MNLIYQLQCTECNAFYIGETHRSLSNHMNGYWFTTMVSNPDLPVAIHTRSHQIPFQKCWSISVIHKLPDSTPRPHPPSVWNCIPTCPPITTHPRSQYPLTPPHSTLTSAALKNFASVSCILLLRKATVIWPKYSFSFSFSSLYVLATLTRGPDDALVSLR